jgi:hypothetical protein
VAVGIERRARRRVYGHPSAERISAEILAPRRSVEPDGPTPDEVRIARLVAQGFHFTAREERRQLVDAEHRQRRRDVDTNVAALDQLYKTLRIACGSDYADRFMEGA